MHRIRKTLYTAALVMGVSPLTQLSTAEITLINGSKLEGSILHDDDKKIILALPVGAGSASMTIQRHQIQ